MPARASRRSPGFPPFIAIIAGVGIALSYGLTWLPEPTGSVDILQESGCTPFADAARVSGTPVWWTYRVCPDVSSAYRLDMRFENGSDTPIGFRYAAWSTHPGRCTDGMAATPVDAGRQVLAGSEHTSDEQLSTWIPRAAFEGRIWLCVSEVEGVTRTQRVLYSMPCAPLFALPGCRRTA